MPTKAAIAKMTEERWQREKENNRKRWANRTEEQKKRNKDMQQKWHANRTEKHKQRHRDASSKTYHSMSKEEKQRMWKERQDRYANLPEEEKERLREKQRLYPSTYANLPEEEKKHRNEVARELRANMTEEEREHKKELQRLYRANLPEENKQLIRDKNRVRMQNLCEEKSEKQYRQSTFSALKLRSKKHGVPFDLTFEQLNEIWPDDNKCPVFGVLMVRGRGKNRPLDTSPNVDRIEPAKGYVMGNVKVMSGLANRIKSNATPAQVMIVAQYLIKEERERAST